ncbi:MAG: sigma-70 family RNA polymerase sigma factor [Actinobacteria bacterium]|nr:sigma-70 family RNA polymerase sigma factor [Actinomycetota bacterium]MDQ3532889.1 sigma-70 family RNA polymerase sigma factor [Actinomycetota bacterium]
MAALRKVEGGGEVPAAANGADEDRDLALSFQRGETDAYQCIYNRYRWSVYNTCYRILDNRDDAQEATQEAFLNVYQALGRFNGNYRLGPWIIRIATNVSLDHLRLRRRRPQDSVSIDALHREPRACTDDPEQILVERAEGERVRKVLSSLPPAHRAAIVLRDSEGLTYSEIALKLGISEAQVKALLHRARKRFKRTWVPAPVLFPVHALDRLRDRLLVSRASTGLMGTSPVADLASATSSVASSGALEHVAGIAGERIAPVVAAAVIGAATIAASVGWVETGSDRDGSEGPAPSVATKEDNPAAWRAGASASAKAPSGNVVAPRDEGFANESNRGDEEAAGGRKPSGEDAQIAGSIEGKDREESKDKKEETVPGDDPSGVAIGLPGDGQELTDDPPLPPTGCSDGQVNEGLTDQQDTGCADDPGGTAENFDPSPSASPPPTECSDDQDNDGDGLVDLGDPGCADDPGGSAENSDPSSSPSPPPECSDDQDNDGDGLVDLEDPGCANDPGGSAENPEQEASSTSPPE